MNDNHQEATNATMIKQKIIAKLDEAFGKIAADLDVSIDIVRNIAHRRRPRLKKGELKNRERMVQQFRNQGYANPDIADALGMSLMQVMQIIQKLLTDGKIEARPHGNFIPENKLRERKKSIMELREKGLEREEIAATLGLGINTVKNTITELIAEGKIEKIATLEEEKVLERKKKIIALRDAGCSNQQICKALDLPYHIVGNMTYQLIQEGVIERQPRGPRKSS